MKEFVQLDNYKRLFENVAFRRAAKNSVAFSVTAVPLSVVLSLGLAVLLERNIPGKSLLRTFFLSPLMVPTASVVLVWQVLFHNHGTINQIIEALGGNTIDWLSSKHGQIVIVLIIGSRRIDRDAPVQALVQRNASPVQRQLAKSHQFVGHTGDVQIREVFHRGIVDVQYPFRMEDAQGERGKGFRQGRTAEHGIRQYGQILLNTPLAVALFEQDALLAPDAHRDAGAALFFDLFLQRQIQRVPVSFHGSKNTKRHLSKRSEPANVLPESTSQKNSVKCKYIQIFYFRTRHYARSTAEFMHAGRSACPP